MELIQKIPFLLGALIAIIVGIISYKYDVSQQDTYLRMAISMVLFFTLGLYIRTSIIKIIKELDERKALEEENNQEELEKQSAVSEIDDTRNNGGAAPSVIDFKIDDDEFTPLALSEAIRSQMKRD